MGGHSVAFAEPNSWAAPPLGQAGATRGSSRHTTAVPSLPSPGQDRALPSLPY